MPQDMIRMLNMTPFTRPFAQALQNASDAANAEGASATSGQGQETAPASTAGQQQATTNPTDTVTISADAQAAPQDNNTVKMTAVAWEPGQPADSPSSLSGMLMSAGYTQEELFAQDPETGRTLIDQVAESNGLRNPNLIEVGRELNIPRAPGREDGGQTESGAAAEAGDAATAESAGAQPTEAQIAEAREMRDAVHERASERDMMGALDTLRNEENATALGALAGRDSHQLGAGDHFTDRDVEMADLAHQKGLTDDIVIDGDRVDWHATGESMRSKMGGGLVDVNLASTQLKRVYDALPDDLSPEQRVARMEEIFRSASEFDRNNQALEGRIKRNGSGVGYSADQIQQTYVDQFSRYQERIETENKANESITRAESTINLANETPAAEETPATEETPAA